MSGFPSLFWRVTATARPWSGCIEDTGQSLPKLMCAPLPAMRRDRVLERGPLGPEPRDRELLHRRVEARPERLEVRDHSEAGEPHAVGGLHELGVRDHRPRSRGPLRFAASSIASSAIRTPPSPIAWMWIWKPSSSNAATASASSAGDQLGRPQV